MSNYNEEAGSYSFPAGEYNRLKREFKIFWDKQIDEVYAAAVRFYERAKKAGKNPDIYQLYEDRRLGKGWAEMIQCHMRLLEKGKNGRYMKPKKMHLAKWRANAIFKAGGHFWMSEASLEFDDERRTVSWKVEENNHAVDDARETAMAGFFFSFLRTVKWRGRTGGSVAYMDEYMRDNGPCEPSYRDMYGFALKMHEDMMGAMLKNYRKRTRR